MQCVTDYAFRQINDSGTPQNPFMAMPAKYTHANNMPG